MNDYTPNFNNKAFKKRANNAIHFIRTHLDPVKPREMSTRYIDKFFTGASNPISKYLRALLLVTTEDKFSFNNDNKRGECKFYTYNPTHLIWLQEQIKVKPPKNKKAEIDAGVSWLQETFSHELNATDFTYKEKKVGNRLYHDMQCIKKEYRNELFSINGMPHDYDIRSASATILYQLHKKVPTVKGPRGGVIAGYDGKPRIFIKTYIHNKELIRRQLANDVNISIDEAKEVFGAVINKARLGTHNTSKIMKSLMKNRRTWHGAAAIVFRLKKHPFLTQFRKEINEMWGILLDLLPHRNIKTDGKITKQKVCGSERYDIYYEEERKVLDAVRMYCRQRQIRVFSIHDGWITSYELDINEVQRHIFTTTGYDIKIDYHNNSFPVNSRS